MPSHELCFLRVYEIALQTGSDRKVPYYFSRNFLVPSLVSCLAAQRTCGVILVLVPIKSAVIDVWHPGSEQPVYLTLSGQRSCLLAMQNKLVPKQPLY